MKWKPIEISKKIIGRTLIVKFDDGTTKCYDTVALCVEWFKMSNDAFYKRFGFNFTPQEAGVYDECRRLVYPDEYTLFGKRKW